jgi:hypothetical protein
MDVIKSISQDELDQKEIEWFKEQYYRIYFDIRKRQQEASAYAINYYKANREKVLKKRQERQRKIKVETPRRPRGRPRKYNTVEDYEIDVVICNT